MSYFEHEETRLIETEATWLAWAKAHKAALALYVLAAVIAIVIIAKLVKS